MLIFDESNTEYPKFDTILVYLTFVLLKTPVRW